MMTIDDGTVGMASRPTGKGLSFHPNVPKGMRMTSETDRALQEIADAVRSVSHVEISEVVGELLAARRIACYAGGREGLVMRGLVMRLFHAGLDVHYVGEMTCPAVGPGDLLVLSCGPGRISMVEALIGVAKRDGARMLYFTAQPQNPPAQQADITVHITAQTMADDRQSAAVLPMGSAYEIALFVIVDLITNGVRRRRSESVKELRSRHTNLE
jgi:6-phospho-3-hexuloisomerase